MQKNIPSSIYLAIAVFIFASSNSITRKIVQIGQNNLIDGRNPISLCNVLFVGNITLILSVCFLGAKLNAWTIVGSLLSFAGVVTTALLTSAP